MHNQSRKSQLQDLNASAWSLYQQLNAQLVNRKSDFDIPYVFPFINELIRIAKVLLPDYPALGMLGDFDATTASASAMAVAAGIVRDASASACQSIELAEDKQRHARERDGAWA